MSQDIILEQACDAYPDEGKLRQLFKSLVTECPSLYSDDEKGFQYFMGDIDQMVELR